MPARTADAARTANRAAIVRQAYAEFDYKTVVSSLSAFMNTQCQRSISTSARTRCIAIRRRRWRARGADHDRHHRDAILRWLAPVLSFTCDEAWRMYRPGAEQIGASDVSEQLEHSATTRWRRSETIRDIRRVVTGALELERAAKKLGSSLEASPLICVRQSDLQHAVRRRSRRNCITRTRW
jgi:isoleucyl-tRNA synthetase